MHVILRDNFEMMLNLAIESSEKIDRATKLTGDSCRTAAYKDALAALKRGEVISIS